MGPGELQLYSSCMCHGRQWAMKVRGGLLSCTQFARPKKAHKPGNLGEESTMYYNKEVRQSLQAARSAGVLRHQLPCGLRS